MNQFLGSLGKHGRLVAGSNEKYFLSSESLGQMQQSSLEDAVTVSHTSVPIRLEVRSAVENMNRERGRALRADHLLV